MASLSSTPSGKGFGFSGHETFPFRLAWLSKGVREVGSDPGVFAADDAIVRLGVGRNMVRSIRHWCVTLDLIEEQVGARGRYVVSELGRVLFGPWQLEGDPFLEKAGTLWWLHWRLAQNRERATSWHYLFGVWPRQEFSKDTLTAGILSWLMAQDAKVPSRTSVERDVDCLLRTYWAPRGHVREESLECPLVALGLIRDSQDRFWLNRGERLTLPDEVFVAALVEFFRRRPHHTATLPAEAALFDVGSPGRVFLMDENSIVARLERLDNLTGGALVYDTTAGLRQILWNRDPGASLDWLRRLYREGTHEVP